MKNSIFRNRFKIYILLIFTGITLLTSFIHPCYAQGKPTGINYTTLIQQADQAFAAKDFENALFLYQKAKKASPENTYSAGKIEEINTILDVDPDAKALLFENIILKAENFFRQKNYPQAKAEYQKALLIDPSAQFPKDRLNEISAFYKDPEDVANFNDAVADGDKAMTVSDYDKAISFFETALTIQPNTKSVKDKIALANKQKAELKTRTEQATKNIASADILLQAGKRTEARAEYQKAIDLTPDNQYVKQKIQEIDNFASNKQALQDKYDKSIEQADQFYINRDFANARVKYQEALNAKPEARYPKEMLEKTKYLESQLQSDQEKYDAALASAESLLKSADYEGAIIGFKSASAIKPSETYPKTKIAEIEKLIADNSSRKEAFEIAIKNGDQSLSEKKFDAALGHYRNALSLLPGEKYPAQKIEEITALSGKQKETDENYKKTIAEADKQFKQDKYEEAVLTYTKALEFKPEENYPHKKILEAQAVLASAKTKNTSYAAAIAKGDQLFSEFNYNEAFAAYELAHNINSFGEYPIGKMAEINYLFSRYSKAIEKGEKALTSGNYDLALKFYQDALDIKPTDQVSQEKITEIKTTVETRKISDDKYATALKTGDQFFAGKDYSNALAAYTEAADLNKNEKYPREQIGKINKLVGDLRSADDNYTHAITEGDNNFTNQKLTEALAAYKKAAVIKPAETYPKTQVEKINGMVAAQAKLDADYSAVVASADKLFAAKKYEEAITDFRKANTLKPEEKYPSEKITESEKQISDIKAIQESYTKAIAEGDKFLAEKDYLSSMSSFKSASSIKPGEVYPGQKITEIQTILDKDKAEGQRYQEALAKADKLYTDKKYTEALESYQQASKIKPTEKYPQEQVTEINRQISAEKTLAEDYQKAITDADNQLKAGKYDEARNLYSNASVLKPLEKMPKDKIAEIDGILAAIQLKGQNYNKAVADGDALFAGKRFQEAITSYNSASVIKPTETYPKTQVEKINILLAEQQKLDDNYLAVIASADQLFDAKKYNEAIADYRKALMLKPTEKYPSEKIGESEKLIADIQALQSTYDKAVANGDKKLTAGEFENALVSFKTASASKPAETYPIQKIAEIQLIIDKQKAISAAYQEAITLADKFFADQKYREALEPYQRASTVKATEKYPQDQITRINIILAEQTKLDEDYIKLISEADVKFKAGEYNDARIAYTNAANSKPGEKLPKDMIFEIDGIIAGLKLKDENYTKAINTAAEFYTAKNFSGAVKSYEEALLIKPEEKYPQERISAIKAETKTVDENYSKAIALGDSKLASKNLMEALNAYQNASEFKPGETYPKTQIAGINASLAAQKEEQDKMYSSYIAEGDRLSGAKDYSGAISAFAKAAGIKPGESYPKQRIIEITKIVEEIELARRAEYNKALGEADKLYNTKVFDLAIDAYEAAAKINPGDSYPEQQIAKIRKYMTDHAIQDLYSQTIVINEGNEKKFSFSSIEPRLRKNNYILLKARSTGKTAPKVFLNYGKDNQKNGGIVLRSLDKNTISDYLIRISIQDKWYREDNNWISLSVETGDIEVTKVQIAAGDE